MLIVTNVAGWVIFRFRTDVYACSIISRTLPLDKLATIPYPSYTHWPARDSGFIDAPLPRITCKKKKGQIYRWKIRSHTLKFWSQNATIWSQFGGLLFHLDTCFAVCIPTTCILIYPNMHFEWEPLHLKGFMYLDILVTHSSVYPSIGMNR